MSKKLEEEKLNQKQLEIQEKEVSKTNLQSSIKPNNK